MISVDLIMNFSPSMISIHLSTGVHLGFHWLQCKLSAKLDLFGASLEPKLYMSGSCRFSTPPQRISNAVGTRRE